MLKTPSQGQSDSNTSALFVLSFFDWLIYQSDGFWRALKRSITHIEGAQKPSIRPQYECLCLSSFESTGIVDYREVEIPKFLGDRKICNKEFLIQFIIHNHVRLLVFFRKIGYLSEIQPLLANQKTLNSLALPTSQSVLGIQPQQEDQIMKLNW